jgi:hypothetical protein
MKKLLLVLSLLISIQAFSQISDIKYFGGIYNKQLYFNTVIFNKDTCYLVVEFSSDGRVYQELFCDSINPMPVPIMHGFQLGTNETYLWVRMTIMTSEKIIDFPTEVFQKGIYTYNPVVIAVKSRPVHGNF